MKIKMAKKQDLRTPIQKLADLLHHTSCHWNHTDGCGYEYESWEDPKQLKKDALRKAIRFTYKFSGIPINKLIKIISEAGGYKIY